MKYLLVLFITSCATTQWPPRDKCEDAKWALSGVKVPTTKIIIEENGNSYVIASVDQERVKKAEVKVKAECTKKNPQVDQP